MKQQKSLTKLELITHPIRLRIVLTLANTARTPQQIAAALGDVPPSSIYRHLELLQNGGLVEVVAERKVRGAVEKTLRLVPNAQLGADEIAQMSADDQRRMLLVFVTQILSEWERYLQQPNANLLRDLAGFRAITFYATDEQWLAAIQAINTTLRPLLEPQPGARPRRFATISFPSGESPIEEP